MLSCTQNTEVLGSEDSAASNIFFRLETMPDGTGIEIGDTLNLELGQSIDIYSVSRDAQGQYLGNPEVTWVYNGDIGPLSIDQNGRHAHFTANAIGSAVIKAKSSDLNSTFTIYVTQTLPVLNFSTGVQNINEGTTVFLPPDWHSISHLHRRKLVIDNSGQSTNLVDFPLLVKLNSSRIDYSKTKNAGEDIRFYDADGTLLPHQIETWDESGDSLIWVKVPQIDALSSSDFIWLFYDESTLADGQSPSAVWNSNYKGVWHLNQGSDSTGVNNGTLNNAVVDSTSPLGDGMSFQGGVANVDLGNDSSLQLNFPVTVSAWVKPNNYVDAFIFTTDHLNTAYSGVQMYLNSSGYVGGGIGNGGDCTSGARKGRTATTDAIALGQWTHVTAVFVDANNFNFYVNGSEVGGYSAFNGSASTIAYTSGSARIGQFRGGCSAPGAMPDDLSIDEVKVQNIAASADWIRAEYLSSKDLSFVNYGIEESHPVAGSPTNLVVTAQIDKVSTSNVSATVNVSGTAFNPSDHNLPSSFPITITAGDTSANYTFNVVTDIDDEPDETIDLVMIAPLNSVLGSAANQTINLLNDDGVPNISVSNVTVTEGQNAVVTVTMSNSYAAPITVDYATGDGSATQPLDYAGVSGTVTIFYGALSATVTIPTYTDPTDEGTENFFLNISNASLGTIVTNQAQVNLNHNFAPAAADDSPFIVGVNTLNSLTGILANDTDPDGDSPVVINAASSVGASLAVVGGNNISYTPPVDFYGIDTVTYTIEDGRGGTDSAQFDVQVLTPFTWVGNGVDDLWSNPLNWCGDVVAFACQGNIGPPDKTTLPGSALNPGTTTTQRAVFNSACTNCNVDVDQPVDVEGFEIQESYAGTLQQNNNGMDVEDFGLVMSSASAIFIGDIAGATIDLKKMNLLAGNFTSTDGQLIVGGDTYSDNVTHKFLEIDSGVTFTTRTNSTLRLVGYKSGNFYPRFDFNIPYDLTFNDVILQGSGNSYNSSYRSRFYNSGAGKLIVNNTLDLLGGELEQGQYDLYGNLLLADTSTREGRAQVNILGSGVHYYDCLTTCGAPLVVINDATITFSPSSSGFVHFWGLHVMDGVFNAPVSGNIQFGLNANIPGSGSTEIFRLGPTATYNVNGSMQYFSVKGTWDNYTNFTIHLDQDLSLNNVNLYAGGSGSLKSCLWITGAGKMIANGNINFLASGNGSACYGGTYDVYGNFTSPTVAWANNLDNLIINFVGSNVQTFTATGGWSLWADFNVDKSGGSLDFTGSYILGRTSSGSNENVDFHIINGTVNLNGFNLQIGDSPGTDTDSVLTLESGTTLNLGGGTLTYESLVNNGGTIN